MYNHSITVWLFLYLKNLFQDSYTYSLILKIASYIQNDFKNSRIYGYVMSDKGFDKFYEDSCFYRFINLILSWFLKAFRCVCKVFSFAGKDGIIHGFVRNVVSSKYATFDYIFASYTVVMMILPHELWNNIYAVAASFAFCAVYFLNLSQSKYQNLCVTSIPLSLIVFVISVIGGVLISPAFFDSFRIALFFIASVLFAIIIYTNIQKEESLKFFVSSLITGLFIMSLYAFGQKIVGVEVDPLLTDVNTNAGMPGRVYATVGNPNNFAEIIVMIIPFIYAMIICSDTPKKKLLYAGVFAVCLGALAMSYSRSGYVAFAIATVVFAIMYNWKLLLPLALVGIICIPFIPETVMNRIFTIGSMQDTSNSYRVYLWEGTSKLIKDYFFNGVGIGSEAFMKVYPDYAHVFAAKAPHSHMLYMELLIELGIIGIASFMIYMFSIIRKGFAIVKKTDKTLMCMIIASISAFFGISFTACVEYIWFYPRVMFIFWMVAGILMSSVKLSKKHLK